MSSALSNSDSTEVIDKKSPQFRTMTKKKKHKKDKRRSSTPSSEDEVKTKNDKETSRNRKDGDRHKREPRRKKSNSPQSSAREKIATHKSKPYEQDKQEEVKGNKISQGSDNKTLHGSRKQCFFVHDVLSSGKSPGSQTTSRLARDALQEEMEEQKRRLAKRRTMPENPRQTSPKAAVHVEEKGRKRKSPSDEDYSVSKTRKIKDQDNLGTKRPRYEELKLQRKTLSETRSRELKKEPPSKQISSCSKPSKVPSPSPNKQACVVTPNSTRHISPEKQTKNRTRLESDSPHHSTPGEKSSSPSSPVFPVRFKIPRKSRVIKTPTVVLDNDDKMSVVIKKRAPPVSVGLSPGNVTPEQNKQRPAEGSSPYPTSSKSHQIHFSPQVQLVQTSSRTQRRSPSITPSRHVKQDIVFTSEAPPYLHTPNKYTETYDHDQEMQLVEELHLARSDKRLLVNMVESYGELTCMDVDLSEEDTITANTFAAQEHREDIIVLDTNILLSHLHFVKKIRSHGLGKLGFPTLLIPWVVLQELDYLKSGKLSQEVERKARPPVHYIYSCLTNQEPRLWGQSMQQASQASCGLSSMNNDDRVLQCCLQYKTLHLEGTVILCTDDKNLCSKALLSGVKALSKVDLEQQAEVGVPVRHIGPVDVNADQRQLYQAPLRFYPDNPRVQSPAKQKGKQCEEEEEVSRTKAVVAERKLSERVSVLESILQSVLSAVLEEEMKAAFQELWLEVVVVKPPWNLEALLQCFRKHWISVFGTIIKRNLLSCVETLDSCLCSGASVDHDFFLTALHAAEELLMALHCRSQYGGHMTSALSSLRTLQCRLQGQNPSPPAENTCSDEDTLMAEVSEEVPPPPQISPQEVWAFFENLWNNVCQISSGLFVQLHYTPASMKTMQPFSMPPPQDALTYLHRLSVALRQLLEAFERILSGDSTVEDAQALLTVINTTKIAAVEPQFTARDLFHCLSQQEYREKLCVGGAQLMDLGRNLDHCSAVCGSN